jgi:hypothetical protein
MGTAAVTIIQEDGRRIANVNDTLDGMQSEIQIANKVRSVCGAWDTGLATSCVSNPGVIAVQACVVVRALPVTSVAARTVSPMLVNAIVVAQLLTRFMKSLYTDKLIIMFVFLIVVAIAGIIAYSIVTKKKNAPATPVT